MKEIRSTSDFEALLRAEWAVLFLDFAWSSRAETSKQIVAEWEHALAKQPGKPDFEIYSLSPDEHPATWKLIGEMLSQNKDREEENTRGAMMWMKNGTVINHVSDASAAGVKNLQRITRSCFDDAASVTASFDIGLLQILCCPETRQSLKLAGQPILERLNRDILEKRLRNRTSQFVTETIDGGLIRADGCFLYPIRENIPVLLVDEAIPITR